MCRFFYFDKNSVLCHNKTTMKKVTFIFTIMITLCAMHLSAVENGFMWTFRANFNGTASLPSINQEDLDKLGAAYMKPVVGYTMDGEIEVGYLFGTNRWFPKLTSPKIFSGMSLFGSIGIGNGYSGEMAGNTVGGVTANVYVHVSYTPVITFGVGSKAYFLNSRLSTGLWLGGKMIASLSPEVLYYSDEPTIKPGLERIPVTEFMMKNMNPLMFSMKTMFEYNQPLIKHMEVTMGAYARFNVWSPKYLTMPSELMRIMNENLKAHSKPEFTIDTPVPSFYLNSLDFGVSVGLTFKG